MPWGNDNKNDGGSNNGSPWGSGQRGSNQNKSRGGGPGSGGQGGPGGPNARSEFEDIIGKIKDLLPKNSKGGVGGLAIGLIFAVVLLLYGISGFYRVLPDEQGVVLRFGKFSETTGPGLNYHLPYPFESVYTPRVTVVNETQIGFVKDPNRRGNRLIDKPEESLMLTGDENIVDIDFVVFWVIGNARNYLFNVKNPEGTIKVVAESSMREVVGRRRLQPILTTERNDIEIAVQELMQTALDEYGAGITIQKVQMDKVDPPSQVISAFRDVQAAKADQERIQNEAQTYYNKVIPEARGQASIIVQAAEAYKQKVVSEAEGAADRFNSVYGEYVKAPYVTRQRIYIETMEDIFENTDKVIIENSQGQGVVPYLPLDLLSKTKIK